MSFKSKLQKLIHPRLALIKVAAAMRGSFSDVQSAINRVKKPQVPLSLQDLIGIAGSIGIQSNLQIVQVGANDGKTGDPIFSIAHKHSARVLLIEPQPWLIDSLRANYSEYKGEIYIENIAISTSSGTLDLYVLRQEHWPNYIKRVGRHPSAIFSPDVSQLLSRITSRLSMSDSQALAAIDKIVVPALPLEDVMRKHDFANADIVQIDCEGWDFEVIKSLGNIRPPIINFEHFNLKADTWHEFRAWATANSYGYMRGPQDTLALRGFPRQIEI